MVDTVDVMTRISNEPGIRKCDVEYLFDCPKYRCFATAHSKLDEDSVKGDHISVRLRPGTRLWAFRTREASDGFVTSYAGHGAAFYPENET